MWLYHILFQVDYLINTWKVTSARLPASVFDGNHGFVSSVSKISTSTVNSCRTYKLLHDLLLQYISYQSTWLDLSGKQ